MPTPILFDCASLPGSHLLTIQFSLKWKLAGQGRSCYTPNINILVPMAMQSPPWKKVTKLGNKTYMRGWGVFLVTIATHPQAKVLASISATQHH